MKCGESRPGGAPCTRCISALCWRRCRTLLAGNRCWRASSLQSWGLRVCQHFAEPAGRLDASPCAVCVGAFSRNASVPAPDLAGKHWHPCQLKPMQHCEPVCASRLYFAICKKCSNDRKALSLAIISSQPRSGHHFAAPYILTPCRWRCTPPMDH